MWKIWSFFFQKYVSTKVEKKFPEFADRSVNMTCEEKQNFLRYESTHQLNNWQAIASIDGKSFAWNIVI